MIFSYLLSWLPQFRLIMINTYVDIYITIYIDINIKQWCGGYPTFYQALKP